MYGDAPRSGHPAAVTAVRGALLAAARWARNSANDSPVPPTALRRAAQKQLQHTIILDWRVSTTAAFTRLRSMQPRKKRTALRPRSKAEFIQQWGALAQHVNGGLRFAPCLPATRHRARTNDTNAAHTAAHTGTTDQA